ncbi:MAG: hypothetical protein ABW048_06425 [Sphingobium sp.]
MDKHDDRRNPEPQDDEKVDRTAEDMERKAEKNANPLAPPINTGAGS